MSAPQNPFFNRHRITNPTYFQGRRAELEQLYGAILTGQCRAVVGERKVGKSSLLSHLPNAAAQQRFGLDPGQHLYAYLDVEGMGSATRTEFWQEVLDQLHAGVHDPDLHTTLRQAIGERELRFMRVRRILRRLRDAGYRIVLMLDEFEALAQSQHFEPDFYGELRSLAGEVGVVYLTGSKRGLYELTYRHSSTLSSPFFNIFAELPLALMSEAEAQEMLVNLSRLPPSGPLLASGERQGRDQGGQPGFSPPVVARALEWAGPHPFFLQLAGYQLWESGAAQGDLAGEELELAQRRFLAEAEDHFRYFWSQLEEVERAGVLHPEQVSEEVQRQLHRRGFLRPAGTFGQPFCSSFAEFARRQEQATPSTPAISPSPGSDLTGESVGPYRVLERCGQGGMSEVYKGYHPMIDRYVAIKVLRPALADDDEFRTRFQREATAIAAMRHPNIVQLHDFGQLGDRFYMVMEFIDAGSLREKQIEGKRLPLPDVVAIVRGVAAALDYAHSRNIVHRDVKPANIMFTRDGDPVLTDFGIARVIRGGEGMTMAGMSVGTPDYMSPEQGMGNTATHHSDIYSLGVALYEMLLGRRPFIADTPFGVIVQHIQSTFPSPRGEDPTFPEALEGILRRALAKDPLERYASAGELAQELQAAVESRE
jgi:tRNA A-37 threonylcarbamoyl transferase component Bud32